MNVPRNITARGYLITTRANNTAYAWTKGRLSSCQTRCYSAISASRPRVVTYGTPGPTCPRWEALCTMLGPGKPHLVIRQNLEVLGYGQT